jgi:colanic acid biosynthesis glycosyl transferase WcaI
MRILFISQLFDPEYSIKGLELMKYWREQGHDVEVLTTFPNYPTGKVFDGYKVKLYNQSDIDGIKVTRLWSYISHSKSKISRASSYISFTIMALLFSIFKKNIDVVYTYHPQSTTGLIGLLMSKLRRIPFITDVQDLWPDALIATGMNPQSVIVRFLGRWCSLIFEHASHIIVLSNGFKEKLIARGVAESKISVVYNWCPEESQIEKVLKERATSTLTTDPNQPAKFLYAGNMGAAQSLRSLIQAAATFSKDEIELTLIGGGVEKNELQTYINENKIDNVLIRDYVPSSQIFYNLSEADILVVHLKDDPLFRITIPSKTQSSLAIGKPVLMAVGGEANELLLQANAGAVSEPADVDSIRASMVVLLASRHQWADLGNNARAFYLENLSSTSNYKKIDIVLNKVVNEYAN